MKGLGKMFVGGLLGAIFGFLISPKRAQKVRDALFGGRSGVGLEPPVRVAIPPAFQAAPSYPETRAPSLPLPAPASPVVVEVEAGTRKRHPRPPSLAVTGRSRVA